MYLMLPYKGIWMDGWMIWFEAGGLGQNINLGGPEMFRGVGERKKVTLGHMILQWFEQSL